MNRKVMSRKLGKLIRRETGIPLPVAMRMGKLFARFRDWELESNDAMRPYLQSIYSGCTCCGVIGMMIKGKKGSIEFKDVRVPSINQ